MDAQRNDKLEDVGAGEHVDETKVGTSEDSNEVKEVSLPEEAPEPFQLTEDEAADLLVSLYYW